ncbi:hypothetical protein ACFYUJ_34400 [Streptomyces sp. NPDC004520]|uniref:hypothetical protein n=1 Tax=Streptomyces sp. NPDC004520 TaxID=3364702 RepID=UPI00367A055F
MAVMTAVDGAYEGDADGGADFAGGVVHRGGHALLPAAEETGDGGGSGGSGQSDAEAAQDEPAEERQVAGVGLEPGHREQTAGQGQAADHHGFDAESGDEAGGDVEGGQDDDGDEGDGGFQGLYPRMSWRYCRPTKKDPKTAMNCTDTVAVRKPGISGMGSDPPRPPDRAEGTCSGRAARPGRFSSTSKPMTEPLRNVAVTPARR